MRCEFCGASFNSNDGSVIYTEDDGEIGICPSCHDDVFQDYARVDIDVMIVPVSEDSLKMAIEEKKEKNCCKKGQVFRIDTSL